MPLPLFISALGAFAGFLGCLTLRRRLQIYARPTRFGQSDSDRLLGRSRPGLPFPYFVHFCMYKFSGLCIG